MKKINLGCGLDYKKGWINTDFNNEVKADVYFNIDETFPFKDNSIDRVYISHCLEHCKNILFTMDEIWRICKPGALIKIFVPHYTGSCALKHLAHHHYFGIGSFDIMRNWNTVAGERYNKARFNLLDERLCLFIHDGVFKNFNITWMFNFTRLWKQIMEKIFIFGFEEIYYKMEVVK